MYKLLAILVVGIFALSGVLAHDTGTPHEEPESSIEQAKQLRDQSTNSWASMLPWTYFSQGDWIKGSIFIAIWFGLIYGFYTLVMLVLGRLVHVE